LGAENGPQNAWGLKKTPKPSMFSTAAVVELLEKCVSVANTQKSTVWWHLFEASSTMFAIGYPNFPQHTSNQQYKSSVLTPFLLRPCFSGMLYFDPKDHQSLVSRLSLVALRAAVLPMVSTSSFILCSWFPSTHIPTNDRLLQLVPAFFRLI